MITQAVFPLFAGWEATKATLHAYSKVVGAIPRTHAVAHPKWWHISLKVVPDGLVTENMPLPGGGIFYLKINFHTHQIDWLPSHGGTQSWSMTSGLTATQLADRIFGVLEKNNIKGDYARQKFESDEPREYNLSHALAYFSALVNVEQVFRKHRAGLPGEVGPIQLWPHGFDLAFEWFGTRQIEFEEHGQKSTFPAQINLGFSPGEPTHPTPYFYSNPFPFETEQLTSHTLPHGAHWMTENWKGSLLEYEFLANDPHAQQKLSEYAKAVYEIASPGLMV